MPASPDPYRCPYLYSISGPNRRKEDWYHGGTVCWWNDGYRMYRGLVRGDGLVLSVDDKGPADPMAEPRAYMVPRPVKMTVPVFKNLFHLVLGHPVEKEVSGISGISGSGNAIGMFVRGETSSFRYDD